jgi:hypothetical protein
MCKLCEKIDVMKDIMEGYFTDEEIDEMNKEIGLEGFNIKGARLSIFIMAIVELCVNEGLSEFHIHDGVEVAIIRDRLRRAVERNNPGRHHTLRERLRGYES